MDGNLEIHQNGIRFRPEGHGSKIGQLKKTELASSLTIVSDLLFSNIKHLFFQPSEKELIVLIHVTLKAPILLGKKKTSASIT